MAVLFQDNFESGDFSQWDSVFVWAEPTVLDVSGAASCHGSFGARCRNSSEAYISRWLGGSFTEVWLRFHLRVDDISQSPGAGVLGRLTGGGAPVLEWVCENWGNPESGVLVYAPFDNYGNRYYTPMLWCPLHGWHCVEFHFKAATAPGARDAVSEMYYDGARFPNNWYPDLDTDALTVDTVQVFGPAWWIEVLEASVDDVVVATERVFPLRGYRVYDNLGAGPVDYSQARDARSEFAPTWTSGGLSHPASWRFGVRAYNERGEEKNVDVAAGVTLLASGDEPPLRPRRPADLEATPRAGGTVEVTFSYDASGEPAACTHFHVCSGPGSGEVNYASPIGSVSRDEGDLTHYSFLTPALVHGARFRFAVRAATSNDVEDDGTDYVTATADAEAPAQPESLGAEVAR